MKLMKLSTKKTLNKHFILQSLPLIVVAIALVLYLYTLLPLSVKQMERSVALVERTYYMQLCIDGKPIAYFNALNDSLMPVSLTHDLAKLTPNRQYLNGCWINRWPLLPSCHGTLLTALPDDEEGENGEALKNGDDKRIKSLEALNGLRRMNDERNGDEERYGDDFQVEEQSRDAKDKARNVDEGEHGDTISQIIRQLEKSINQHKRTGDELQYYLLVHNVNDEGFHTMAEYAEQLKMQLDEEQRLYNALTQVADSRRISISTVSTYRILLPQQPDTADDSTAKTCTAKTCTAISCTQLPVKKQPFIVLQTADRKTPQDARPIHLQQWLTPSPRPGRTVVAAAIAGTTLSHHPTTQAAATQDSQAAAAMQRRSGIFQGTVTCEGQHDIPALLAPNAAPVFSADGRLMGINYRHHIITPDCFGWKLQHLMP